MRSKLVLKVGVLLMAFSVKEEEDPEGGGEKHGKREANFIVRFINVAWHLVYAFSSEK